MANSSAQLKAECSKIEENCLYTGQTHFEMAKSKGRTARMWLVLAPSLVSAVSGLAVALDAPKWIGAFAALAGAISSVASFLGIAKEATAHETAGRVLTQLRDEARALRETHSGDLAPDQFATDVRALGTRYRAFIACLPLTDDAAFEKVRQRVKQGVFWFDADAAGPEPTPEEIAVSSAR